MVLLLELSDDFAFSLLNVLSYSLELEAFGFFDAIFNLQFFDERVHLGQRALVTSLDIEKHFKVLRNLFFLLLQLLLPSLQLKCAFFTGLVFLDQVCDLSFLRVLVNEAALAEHASGFESRVVVPKLVGYITVTRMRGTSSGGATLGFRTTNVVCSLFLVNLKRFLFGLLF